MTSGGGGHDARPSTPPDAAEPVRAPDPSVPPVLDRSPDPVEGAGPATALGSVDLLAAGLVSDLVDEAEAEAEAQSAWVGRHTGLTATVSGPKAEPAEPTEPAESAEDQAARAQDAAAQALEASQVAEADAHVADLDLSAPPGDDEVGLLRSELNSAKVALSRLAPKQLRDGTWFHAILQRTASRLVRKQQNRSLIGPWRTRYPDLDETDLSRRIIAAASRRTAAVGGLAGAAMTAVELGVIGTLGLAVPAAVVLALAELAVLERIQLSMVFTLAAQYDVPMGHEKLHEVGALYAHVLRIKGASRAAAWSRTGTLALTRVIGLRFARQAAVKMALPVVSMGIGAGMNYLMTRTLGRHTLRKFRQSDHTRGNLARVIDRDPEARRLLFCLMVRMAAIDGQVDRRERDLLRQTLDELAPDPEEHAALEAEMHQPEAVLLARLKGYTDPEFHDLVFETLSLMAVTDGQVAPSEEALLRRVCEAFGQVFDPAVVHARFQDFMRTPSRLRLPRLGSRRAASEASRSTSV